MDALRTCYRIVFIVFLFQIGRGGGAFAFETPASSRASDRRLAPARGHYARLAQLDPQPSGENLPVDAERWKTDPKFIERVEKIEPHFVNVPLDRFVLPPCPANSSRQTRAEIDYLLRL